ncbi:MAG: aminotransferase class I/II-fold pyridoxal phosphate-dependent enzyme [Microthrixaceae bacterium]
MIDGCRLSRSQVEVSRHSDVEHVESLLSGSAAPRKMVVVDSVYSMDGDTAPLGDLAAVCARQRALLVLDDAHNVLGPSATELRGVPGLEVLHVATLSKALGSLGGAVCGPRAVVELLVNRARSFIFSTALGPSDTAAAIAALEVLGSAEGNALLRRLRELVDRVSPGHPSPIVPFVVGSERDALVASERLLELGLLIPAIRPPTVPPGTSRLRVAMSAAHSDAMVDALLRGLEAVGLGPGAAEVHG